MPEIQNAELDTLEKELQANKEQDQQDGADVNTITEDNPDSGEEDMLFKETLANVAKQMRASNDLSEELSAVDQEAISAAVAEVAAATVANSEGQASDPTDHNEASRLELPKDLEAHLISGSAEDTGFHHMDDEELQLHFQKVIEEENKKQQMDKEEEKERTGTEQQDSHDILGPDNVIRTDENADDDGPEDKDSEMIREIKRRAMEQARSEELDLSIINRRHDSKDEEEDKSMVDNYNGLTVPADSELLKGSNAAVQKYNSLIQDSSESLLGTALMKAQLSALPLTLSAPSDLPFNVQLLIHTLPVIDNLATQILRTIAQGPYEKIMEMVANADNSYSGIAFTNLVNIFETTKKIYNSDENPFFTVENITHGLWKFGKESPSFLRGKEDSIESTLRKVNLATFLIATLGLVDLGFFYLNEAFLDVFCSPQNLDSAQSMSELSQNGSSLEANMNENFFRSAPSPQISTKFLKSHAILYLDLKTQAFISAIELNNEGSRNIDGTIRKNISKEEILNDLFPKNLDEILYRRKHPDYDNKKSTIKRNSMFFTPTELDFLNRCDHRKINLLNSDSESSLVETYEWVRFLSDLLEYVSKNVGFLIWGSNGKMKSELENLKRSATDIEADMELKRVKLNDPSSSEFEANKELEFYRSYYENNQKTKPIKKRIHLYRRIWSKEEEEALVEGLKKLGPQWSAILSLYGPGGEINETLKNRTALQLKDKARNWKYFYLRRNAAIPDYLEGVTGELEYQAAGNAVSVVRPKSDTMKEQLNHLERSADSNDTKTDEKGEKEEGSEEVDPSLIDSTETNDRIVDHSPEEGDKNSMETMIKDLFKGQVDNGHDEAASSKMDSMDDSKNNDSIAIELKDLVAEAFK